MDFEKIFWLPNTLYLVVGYDFRQVSKSYLKKILMTAFLILTNITGICIRIYMLIQLRELVLSGDMLNSFRLGVYISYAFDSIVKFFGFLHNAHRLRKIYESLATEFPQTFSEQQFYQVHKYSFNRSRILIFAYLSVTNSILLGPIVQSIIMYIIDAFLYGLSGAKFQCLHPTPITYNFNFCSPRYYIPIYIVEYLNGHFLTTTSLGTDLYVCTFAAQVCMHLKYLGNSLEGYEPSADNSKADCAYLKEWIKKHQLMLR